MVKQEFQDCFRQLALLGFGILFIAHSKERETEFRDENGEIIKQQFPRLSSGAVEVINGMVDIIGYIEAVMKPDGTTERWLYTRATQYAFAGSRYAHLKPKIPFGYNELIEAIGEAIDESVEEDGAVAVDHVENVGIIRRPFDEIMKEAQEAWKAYLSGATDDEDKTHRLKILKSLVRQNFGSEEFKVSQATPEQSDIVELFTGAVKELL